MNVLWFSCGVSSAIVAYLCKDELDKIIYQHIDDQEPDSLRFLHDVETLIGREIEIQQSQYKSVDSVCRAFGFVSSPFGAKCTDILKKRQRKEWEADNAGRHTYYWGMDCEERGRSDRLVERMTEHDHRFPLIEQGLIKQDVHAMAVKIGLKRPLMYNLGYPNNNCIGCVKGGKGYWNKIRIDFPEVFKARAKMERDIGHSCLNGIFLDELDPNAGNMQKEIMEDCGIMCEIAMQENAMAGQ